MANKHEHYWNYEHPVFSTKRGGHCIRRWCTDCGLLQTATVKNWRKTIVSEFGEFDFYPKGYPKKFKQEQK